MSDFFDEKHWWNQKAERDVKVPFPAVIWKHGPGLTWCPFHNYYYTKADGQTCLRCDEERARRERRTPPANCGPRLSSWSGNGTAEKD